MKVIFFDSSPLALIVQRQSIPQADACRAWAKRHIDLGTRLVVPEIIRYELRRELLRLGKDRSLQALEMFIQAEPNRFLPLTSKDLDRAANMWAETRRRGIPTADPHALDIDVILAAQAMNAGLPPADFIVATANVGHLSQFVPCKKWDTI